MNLQATSHKYFTFLVRTSVLFLILYCSTSGRLLANITSTPIVIKNDTETTGILIKTARTIIYTPEGDIAGSRSIWYEVIENKLVSSGYRKGKPSMAYSYVGNLMTKIEDYDFLRHTTSVDYTYYPDNRLANSKWSKKDYKYGIITHNYKTSYTYGEGSITAIEYSRNLSTGLKTLERTEKYFYSGGNLVRYVHTNSSGVEIYNVTYEYDKKNNPYKNFNLGILSEAVLDKHLSVSTPSGFSSVNNVIKKQIVYPSKSKLIATYKYEYNANNYPTKRTITETFFSETVTSPKAKVLITEYTYY